MKKGSFCFAGAGFVLGLSLIMGGVFVQNGAAQEGSGGEPLVTWGDYVLQGTALVQYQGKTEQDLVIPPDLGITEIRDEAFYRSSIRSAAIPEGVTKLGTRSFSDCYHLERVTLPRSLAEIGKNAFSSCSSLASITLPASLTAIGVYAFSGCSSLASITIQVPKPPALGGSLWLSWRVPPVVIYVPAAALDAYKNDAGWKTHADRIQAAGG